MSSSLQERKPFLDDEGDAKDQEACSHRYGRLQKKRAKMHRFLFAVHFFLVALNVFLLVSNSAFSGSRIREPEDKSVFDRTFSPADSALHYITVEELNYEHHTSRYTGEPRPELDQAWSHLLRSTLLKITKEEMIKMNKTSLALLRDGGYVGYLESFHMLHCLKRIYQSHHPEHYPQQEQDGAFDTAHLYHCLDVLREGVMCNADVTINTLFWETPTKVQGTRPGPRKCVDWDRLQSWAEDRTLTASDRETFLANLVVPFDDIGSMGPKIPSKQAF